MVYRNEAHTVVDNLHFWKKLESGTYQSKRQNNKPVNLRKKLHFKHYMALNVASGGHVQHQAITFTVTFRGQA